MKRALYRLYRRIKVRLLTHKPGFLGLLFFRVLECFNFILSPQKRPTKEDERRNALWKEEYRQKFGAMPLYRVETAAPVALYSDDHKMPRGAIYDNSRNPRFNRRVYALFKSRPGLKVLDLGCAGGGLVRSFLEDGHVGVGLEGSDQPRALRTGEWGTCPNHLYTCDISRPFRVLKPSGEQETFDLITAWEVLEHIPEARLADFMENIRKHLSPEGYFVGSVDTMPDGNPLTGAVYHVTLKPRSWWLERFAEHGLEPVDDHLFDTADYVRGNGQTLKDWDPADGEGFHVVMRRA